MKLAVFITAIAAIVAEARKCVDLKIPVTLESRNGKFDMQVPRTERETTDFLLNFAQPGANLPEKLLTGYKTIRGNYHLGATYCEPDSGKSDTLQILTHGVGFDRRYWDFAFHNYNYSYVEQAVDKHGYSTLSWDRLGIGASSRGDPINEIQFNLELAALYELTQRAKQGKISGIKKRFRHVQHAGHSFGSLLTYTLVSTHPQASEAIALTGFGPSVSFIAQFALGSNFVPAAELDIFKGKYAPGYLAPKSSIGVEIDFFAPGDYDPALLDAATRTGQPVTVGELLSQGGNFPAENKFKGRVFVITGNRDIPFCGGNCTDTTTINGAAPDLIQPSKNMFPHASSFSYTIVPGAGHGLNYGYSHSFTYARMLNFFTSS